MDRGSEADAFEQSEPAGDPPDVERPHVGIDVPEADAIEQSEPVGEPPAPERPHLGLEVPEADALEQSQPAPYDDDDQYE
jgi:hypothetical protein